MSRSTTYSTSGTVTGARRALFLLSFGIFSLLPASRAEVIGVNLQDASEGPASAESDNGIASLYDPLLRLNRYTFHKTISEQHSDEVPHWIVLFCPNWYEPCQALQPTYRQLAEKWQEELNGALLSTQVRFASVDCATEKDLCNTQGAGMEYPYVAHYRQRKQAARWRGKSFETDGQRLKSFVRKQLGALAAAGSEPEEDVTAEGAQSIPVDFLLIFAAIAGNAWFISRGSAGGEAASRAGAADGAKQPMGGPASAPAPAEQRNPCVARSLPKEWGSDRGTLEL